MIAVWLARLAMLSSLLYFSIDLGLTFFPPIAGDPGYLWEELDIPQSLAAPPLAVLLAGIFTAGAALSALAVAYWSIERILHSGPGQEFSGLAVRMRTLSLCLLGFWAGYNLLISSMPVLATAHLPEEYQSGFEWDPFDIDIILVVIAVALNAISHSLRRASLVEEENKHFL